MFSAPVTPALPIKAIIFDLDGVITRTAKLHSRAWKVMFDRFLEGYGMKERKDLPPFDPEQDYRHYVDGRTRYEGVRAFLTSRNIIMPYGEKDDEPGMDSICALGNMKNQVFHEVLSAEGVEVFESTITFLREARKAGLFTAVASSSRNCREILERAGLLHMMDVIVDGNTLLEKKLPGKPAPDIFLLAASSLLVTPGEAVVIEDAWSGVRAAADGNFGLVIGLARENNHCQLKEAGAGLVVEDLEKLKLEDLRPFFSRGKKDEDWILSFRGILPGKERHLETLLTTGNGYFACRGSLDGVRDKAGSYPGLYMAGLYNKLTTNIQEVVLDNEDLVRCPDVLEIKIGILEDHWLDDYDLVVHDLQRNLDLRNGLLTMEAMLSDTQGHSFRICSRRFVSMENPHLLVQQYSVTPGQDHDFFSIRSGIAGNICNEGVPRYRELSNRHWAVTGTVHEGTHCLWTGRTSESGRRLEVRMTHKILTDGAPHSVTQQDITTEDSVYQIFTTALHHDQTLTLEKTITLHLDPEDNVSIIAAAENRQLAAAGFKVLLESSSSEWEPLWDKAMPKPLEDKVNEKMLRLNTYHLLISFSPHNVQTDSSIPARGLHGEAYRGHIFWDELFIFPFYARHFPDVARAMLMYRYHRLEQARRNAAGEGFAGALYPWQSASRGTEETQKRHLNPVSGKWDPDHSRLQRHVSLAIALNVLRYDEWTMDKSFLLREGGEMITEILRFWASAVKWNENRQRYDLSGVMGPDEFHEKHPNKEEAGLCNNAYTNVMLAWLLQTFTGILENHPEIKIYNHITGDEFLFWKEISVKMAIPVHASGLIEQFEGYLDLRELDWEKYRKKYPDLSRLDRILKAEGLSPDSFKVSKQADVLQLFYNLEEEVITTVLERLGYRLPPDYLSVNYNYYLPRATHGSTLSKLVFARAAFLASDEARYREFLHEALMSDYLDIQGGSTGEGIHAGVMGGTVNQ